MFAEGLLQFLITAWSAYRHQQKMTIYCRAFSACWLCSDSETQQTKLKQSGQPDHCLTASRWLTILLRERYREIPQRAKNLASSNPGFTRMMVANQWNELLVRFIGGIVSNPMTIAGFARTQSHLRFVHRIGKFSLTALKMAIRQLKENECYLLTQRNNPLDYSSKSRLPLSGYTMSWLK